MNALKGSFRMNLHWTHVAIVFVNCYSGMASGFIMKYLDNVVRNIVVALGTVALTVVSAFMLGNELTFLFLMGAPLIVAGSYYFNKLKQKKSRKLSCMTWFLNERSDRIRTCELSLAKDSIYQRPLP